MKFEFSYPFDENTCPIVSRLSRSMQCVGADGNVGQAMPGGVARPNVSTASQAELKSSPDAVPGRAGHAGTSYGFPGSTPQIDPQTLDTDRFQTCAGRSGHAGRAASEQSDISAEDEAFEERAAIMQFDGGMTRQDAEASARQYHPG